MIYKTGEKPGVGKYKCTKCGLIIDLANDIDALPVCPKCHFTEYEKVS